MEKNRTHRLAIHLSVLGAYSALALVLTWPLVRHLSTHVPGSYTWAFDEYTFLWNTWWFRFSLLTPGHNPLYSDYIFYPIGIGLALYTYNLFNAAVALPLEAFLSLPAISNLTFLLSTVLSGYGAFLLVDYLLRPPARASDRGQGAGEQAGPGLLRPLAAFLGGLIFAFGSYRMVYAAIGHYDLWSTIWIPLYALYLVKTFREPGLKNPLLAGLFLALAMLCEMIFGVFLAMLGLILLAFALGRRARRGVAGGLGGLARRGGVLLLVAVLVYLPLLIPILREMSAGYELAGWGDAEKLSVDLLGFVTPTALHPLGGDWVETLRQVREGTARFRDVNTVFLGWAGLALALVGAVACRKKLAAWTTSAVLFALFCLGPVLQVGGKSTFDLDGLQVNVPLPFILLHYLPVIKANRVPNRFSVVLMLSLAVLAGFGAHWLLGRLARWRRGTTWRAGSWLALTALPGLLLAGCILFEHWSAPLPLTDARIPAVFESLAADGADYAILQLPLGWRNSFGMLGTESTQTEYYQSFHGKRLLSGNTSRNPPIKFDYFRRVPILESLIVLQTYGEVPPERRASDRATAGDLVSFYDIRYVAVAPGIPGRPPYVDTRAAALAYVEEVLPLEKVYDQEGWLLYRVEQGPLPSRLRVDLASGEPLEAMALAEGWAEAEEIQGVGGRWATEQGARLFLPAVERSDYRLTMTALPFDFPGSAAQEVRLSVNGRRLETIALASGWREYAWEVPADLLRRGPNELRFSFSRLDAPADVVPGNGAIGRTGVQAPLAIEVNSGGPADFAWISLGEGSQVVDGSAHGPGYNLAVLHPRTGRLLERRWFNTTPSGNQAEAAALAEFVAQVPRGQIVAVAMQGNGAANLSDEAVAALRTLGSQVDPRGQADWSHAIIGVKGAAPGTALEAAGPFNAWLRAAPDRRTLGMAVDAITWESLTP